MGLAIQSRLSKELMRETQAYCLKWLLDLRGSLLSCELQCRISRSATN